MEENKKIANISFFKKVWYSITNFEKYPSMAAEGVFKAISYMITMTIIVTAFAVVGSMFKMNKTLGDLAQYIENNIPEFTFADGNISMDIKEPIIINDVAYQTIDKVIINPLLDNDEQKEQYRSQENVDGTTIYFFKDTISLVVKADNNEQSKSYTYKEFLANYTKEDLTSFNKADFVKYIQSDRMMPFYMNYCGTIFMGLLLTGIIYALLDIFRVAVFGWVTSVIAKIKMKFMAVFNMSVYAFTLSMILNIIYLIINYFTDFTIKYFQVAYTTIAYIYLAAAIFILKDDFIKKMQEVMKIRQEQKNVREEIKKQEDKDDDNADEKDKREKEDNKEDDDDEPQGSEA